MTRETSDLVERRAVGLGELRVLRDGTPTGKIYEYEEAGRVFRETMDPRETGNFMYLRTELGWTEPPGPITQDERERIYDAFCGAAPTLFDATGGCSYVVRWSRGPDGYLVDVQQDGDAGNVVYHELGHTVGFRVARDRTRGGAYVVERSALPKTWHHPPGSPIDDATSTRIFDRLAKTTTNLWGSQSLTVVVHDDQSH